MTDDQKKLQQEHEAKYMKYMGGPGGLRGRLYHLRRQVRLLQQQVLRGPGRPKDPQEGGADRGGVQRQGGTANPW